MLSPRGAALICKYAPFLSSWIRHVPYDILVRTEEEIKEVQERIAKLRVQVKDGTQNDENELARLEKELFEAGVVEEALKASVHLLHIRDVLRN